MTDDHQNPLGDFRYYGLHIGVVADRKDPDGLGRVRIRIPAMHEPMGPWAWPLGGGGGSAQQGTFIVPQEGAEVGVFFKEGDPDHPYFLAGNYGIPTAGSEVPTPVKAAPDADKPNVAAFEFGRFFLAFDMRDGHNGWTIVDKLSGDFVEYDGEKMGMKIKVTSALLLEADGLMDLKAAMIVINGRNVLATDRAI